MEDVQVLLEMGFSRKRAEYALKITCHASVEAAMDWLLAHADEELPEDSMQISIDDNTNVTTAAATDTVNQCSGDLAAGAENAAVENAAAPEAAATNAEEINPSDAKSLKCDECGKLFKNETEAEYHALRSKHNKFSESAEEKPPLTEEEKRVQMQLIEQKLKQKRTEREERERRDELERERNRIRSGKDMTEARKRMEELEMAKLVEQRKREKIEDKAARDRVRQQIESDKALRKAQQQKQQQKTESAVALVPVAEAPAIAPNTTATTSVKKVYTQTRIQVRLLDGSTLQSSFAVNETLGAVRAYIRVNNSSVLDFKLMTTFPRKVFDEEDYEKPLQELGLVPSAVLIMTNAALNV